MMAAAIRLEPFAAPLRSSPWSPGAGSPSAVHCLEKLTVGFSDSECHMLNECFRSRQSTPFGGGCFGSLPEAFHMSASAGLSR